METSRPGGISVRDALRLPALAGVTVLAGSAGLEKMIRFVNIMEVPDVLPWTKPDELLLTTGYPLRSNPESLEGLLRALDARGLAGMAVKLGRYLDELPSAMLRTAEALGFPVLRIPDGIGFDEILNQVLSEVLGRQAALLARGEQAHAELLQLVLRGGGLPEVTAALPRQLVGVGEPSEAVDQITVMYVDRTGAPVTRAGALLTPELSSVLFDDDGDFRSGPFGHGLHRVSPDGTTRDVIGNRHSVLVASVAAEGHQGRLVAVGPGHWDTADVITLERGATVAALVINRELAVAAVERKYRGDFLRDLLTGRTSGLRAEEAARGFGWDLNGPMVIVVATATEPAHEPEPSRRRRVEQLAATWTALVRRIDPDAAEATFAAEAVAVLHAPQGGPQDRQLADLIAGLAGRGQSFAGTVGVSRVFRGIDELPGGYGQAWEAVKVGRRLSGSGSASRFDDLGLYRLLALIPESGELRSFLADVLGPLAGPEGDTEADELRRTLVVLLDNNLNVALAARELHFHYNTLRYRIGKLERLLGSFTTDARLRADLTVAMYVWQMRVAR